MKTIRVSATEARNNFFSILNQVLYEGVQVVIGKTGTSKEVILMPKSSREKEHEKRVKALNETFGALPDFPEVTKFRHSRIKPVRL